MTPYHFFSRISFLLIVFSFSHVFLQAQLKEKYKGYSEARFNGMSYGLFQPLKEEPGKKYPLVLYLHGANDTVSRDLQLYQHDVQQKHPCFVLTPKCLEANQSWGNTWIDKHSTATANTIQLIDSLLKIYPIDTDRLYIYGISMGGFGTFAVLQKNKESLQRAIVFAVALILKQHLHYLILLCGSFTAPKMMWCP